MTLNYVLPISGPSNFTLAFGGQTYALAVDNARGGVPPTAPPSSGPPSGGTCTAPAWTPTTEYNGAATVSHAGHTWRARWWTKGQEPGTNEVWTDLGPCAGGPTSPPSSGPPSSGPPSSGPPSSGPPSGGTGCTGLPTWNATTEYQGNTQVRHNNRRYRSKWWTRGEDPSTSGQWGAGADLGPC